MMILSLHRKQLLYYFFKIIFLPIHVNLDFIDFILLLILKDQIFF